MSNNLEVKEYAKELYLTPDDKGRHKYSLRQIATKIQQRFNKKVNYSTISLWAQNEGWQNLWEEAYKIGATEGLKDKEQVNEINQKIIEERKKKQSTEEVLQERIINAKKNDFIRFETLKDLAFKDITSKKVTETDKEGRTRIYYPLMTFNSKLEAAKVFDIACKYSEKTLSSITIETESDIDEHKKEILELIYKIKNNEQD